MLKRQSSLYVFYSKATGRLTKSEKYTAMDDLHEAFHNIVIAVE